MCGIVGFVSSEKYEKNTILNMCSQLESRGPDDSGVWIDDSLGIILIKSEDEYGLFSTDKGFILNLAYDQITDIIDSDGNRLFKAIQIIPDAELLVNIIVNSDGKIILNQGIELGLLDRINCDIL